MAVRMEIHEYRKDSNMPKVLHSMALDAEHAAPHIPQIGGRVQYLGDRFRVTDIAWVYKQAGTLIIVEVETA